MTFNTVSTLKAIVCTKKFLVLNYEFSFLLNKDGSVLIDRRACPRENGERLSYFGQVLYYVSSPLNPDLLNAIRNTQYDTLTTN